MRNWGMLPSLAVVLILLGTGSAQGKDDEKSSAKLDGKWYVARQEEFGRPVPEVVAKRLSMIIDGDKMEWYIGNPAPNFVATITIDEGKKTIAAKITRGSFIGKTMLGIYKFEKDQLHMCWGEIGTDKRPEEFATAKRGGGLYNYTVYSRTKDQDEKKPSARDPKSKPEAFDPGAVRKLQATLPDGWKDDGTILDVRRFYKDDKEKWYVFALLYKGDAPKSAEALAELAKRDPSLFPHRQWLQTTGIGKLSDGFFIVGKGQAGGFEDDLIGAVRTIDGKTVLFTCVPAGEAAARKEMLGVVRAARFGPEAPPDLGPKQPSSDKRPPLANLKLTLAKGWEAKHQDGSNTWRITHNGFTPSVTAGWAPRKDYPKDLDDYVDKLQKNGDHFAYGVHWSSVREKGELSDGFYVVGKVQLKSGEEGKEIGFSIIRDLGGEKVIFESFSKYYDDAKLLKEAIEICKSAKF
jgi:uncharacterized protein (TIGR03067 family)